MRRVEGWREARRAIAHAQGREGRVAGYSFRAARPAAAACTSRQKAPHNLHHNHHPNPTPRLTSSTIFFSSMCLGPRFTAEQVTTILGEESEMRPASDSAEKPAKTTEKTAPMRAQASCGRGAGEKCAAKRFSQRLNGHGQGTLVGAASTRDLQLQVGAVPSDTKAQRVSRPAGPADGAVHCACADLGWLGYALSPWWRAAPGSWACRS